MTLNALDAVIGVVYLTPKGRQLLRIDNAPDTPADSVRFRRMDEPRMGEEINVVGTYPLTPAPVEAPPVTPSRVAKLLGAPIDTIVAAVEAREEPYKSSPLSDDDIEELMSLDSRDRVMRALRAEHARRIDAATVRAPLHAEAPAIVVVAQGPIDVEEVPLVVGFVTAATTEGTTSATVAEPVVSAEPPPPGNGEWRDGVLVPEDEVVGPVTYDDGSGVTTHVPAGVRVRRFLSPSERAAGMEAKASEVAAAVSSSAPDDLPWPASSDSDPLAAPIVDAPTDEQTDAPISPVEPETTIGAAPVSDAISPADGDRSSDDAATSSAAAAPTEPAKPEKVRPRGWCPACRQFLTVRADGTMMQHYTPDGAKGPDGKRIDCQGVGLTPAAERPPEPRLPLPVAMKVDPPVAPVVERPALVSPSSDPVIAALVEEAADTLSDADFDAMDAIREHDAGAPPVAVRVPAPPVLHRYTVGGGSPYGWIIFDLLLGAAMEREDGTLARWEHEADARAALVYVREHGELPGDVSEEPAFIPTGGDAHEPESPPVWPVPLRPVDERPVTTTVVKDATGNRPGNPLEALTRIVEEAKTRGVRIRIVIEPIE